jgi:chromosome segregation ATPase
MNPDINTFNIEYEYDDNKEIFNKKLQELQVKYKIFIGLTNEYNLKKYNLFILKDDININNIINTYEQYDVNLFTNKNVKKIIEKLNEHTENFYKNILINYYKKITKYNDLLIDITLYIDNINKIQNQLLENNEKIKKLETMCDTNSGDKNMLNNQLEELTKNNKILKDEISEKKSTIDAYGNDIEKLMNTIEDSNNILIQTLQKVNSEQSGGGYSNITKYIKYETKMQEL